MRAQLNRLVVVAALTVALPAIAVCERLRPGAGRRLAVRAIGLVARACGIRFEVDDASGVPAGAPCVLVPNHTSPLDIAAVIVARPGVRFVAAAELFRVPLLASAMRALGTVPIDRGDRAASRRRIGELSRADDGGELVIFPEGGISSGSDVQRFKTGGFVVAIERHLPVVPVAISGASGVLARRGRLLMRPGTVRVRLLDAISTAALTVADRAEVAQGARDRVIGALRAQRAA